MKLSVLPVTLSACVVLVVVNSSTFVDGLIKCKSLSKTKCDSKGDGICMWKNKKCKTKCDLFKGDDSKNCEKVKGCKLKGKKCKKIKKKPKECGDLSTKKCGKRDDCVIIEDGGTSTCATAGPGSTLSCDLLNLLPDGTSKCAERDDCVIFEDCAFPGLCSVSCIISF
mmetsp:Transcript_19661/g.20014  ORF Transcript_19661/g.20014 Transcript_19661/m.20014 type:complete len:168 (-) Transcript_19661:175-678(-)